MIPDPETFTVLPWLPSHASMCCDLVEQDGERYDACTRTWLKDMIERAAERGLRIQAAFEPEFYLGRRNARDRAVGAGRQHRHLRRERLRPQGQFLTDMTRTLRAMGMLPEMVYHEGGPGQQEISIRHAPALRAADNQMKLRNAVRGVALEHGYYASFAPKPFPWTFGSGAHVHLSVWDIATESQPDVRPARARRASASSAAGSSAASCSTWPALIALTCPSYNSYRRLQPRSWSTAYLCWGYDNRQAAVRAASPFWGREAET